MANEKRLIDADALNWGTCPTYGKLVKAWLDDAPTVDAVEVVRCKDCKHWLERDAYGMGTYHQCWITGHIPNKDHFCSYGERREGE